MARLLENALFLSFVTALGAAIWPILAKTSGTHHLWVQIIVYASPVFIGFAFRPPPQTFTWSSTALLLGAFLTMGVVAFCYTKLINLPKEELSQNLPLGTALFNLFILFGGILLLGESFTLKKTVGILTIIAGILLVKL